MNSKRITCPESFDQDTGRDLWTQVAKESLGRGDEVVLDFKNTQAMDSLGGAWLVRLSDRVREKGATLRFENQREQAAEFIQLVEPGLQAIPERSEEEEGVLEEVGGRVLRWTGEFEDFFSLVVDSIYWTVLAPVTGRGFRWGLFLDELYEMGVRAVRINCLMNFLLGLIIAMLSAAQVAQFGLGIYVADLIIIAFTRELGAIMTAVVVSARTGAAIAAELATMKVQEEIDALRGMGLNVPQFLVAPKIVALLVAMPCLVALGMLCGTLGGAVWGILVLDFRPDAWFIETVNAAAFSDIFEGMLKCLFFAIMIVLVGCHNGLRVVSGARGVGLMTTRAVVMDIFFIIVIDIFFAAIFYYVLD